jgi:hypothetical protein
VQDLPSLAVGEAAAAHTRHVTGTQLKACTCAALRKLDDTGIPDDAVRVVHTSAGWVHYEWPERTQQKKMQNGSANWKGQRQVHPFQS